MTHNILLTVNRISSEIIDDNTPPGTKLSAYNLDEGTTVQALVSREPAHEPGAQPGDMTIVFNEYWFVLVRFSDGSHPYRIRMGEIDNQPGWVNTEAGANTCVTDIESVL